MAQTFETGADNQFFSLNPTFAGIRWERRNDEGFAYDISYNYTGKQMNPDMGFLRRNDVHGVGSRVQYGWFPGSDSRFFSNRVMFQYRRYNRVSDGGLESMEISPGWMFNTKKGFGAFVEIQYMGEGVEEDFELGDDVWVPAGEYGFFQSGARIFTPQSKPVSAMIRIEGGEFFDGDRFSVEASPTLNLSASLQLTGAYEFNVVHFPTRGQEMTSHLGRINILYMFNTKLSASAFVQVNNASDAFMGNFRIRYNPREGNDLYLVYNEYRGFMETEVFPPHPPYYNRTILLKYTHTFRL
jgi:hypothetical protein